MYGRTQCPHCIGTELRLDEIWQIDRLSCLGIYFDFVSVV